MIVSLFDSHLCGHNCYKIVTEQVQSTQLGLACALRTHNKSDYDLGPFTCKGYRASELCLLSIISQIIGRNKFYQHERFTHDHYTISI